MADIDVYKEWLGIPEGDRPPDHYTLLRLVQFEDDGDKIQANYRKLNAHVRKYATGQYLKPSQDLLNELAKAMLCLSDPVAKRDYDTSMGREPQADADDQPKTALEYLVTNGTISRPQADEVQNFADARGLSIRDAVIQMKLASPADATKALAHELGLPVVDLNDMVPEDDVLDKLPRSTVRRHSCIPLFEDNGRMLVACTNLPTPELEDEVRMRYGHSIRPVLAAPRAIQKAISTYYAKDVRDEATAAAAAKTSTKAGTKKKGKEKAKAKPAKKQQQGLDNSPEAKAKRQQVSLIAICWAFVVPLIGSTQLGLINNMMVAAGLGAACAAVTAGLLKLTYWK